MNYSNKTILHHVSPKCLQTKTRAAYTHDLYRISVPQGMVSIYL